MASVLTRKLHDGKQQPDSGQSPSRSPVGTRRSPKNSLKNARAANKRYLKQQTLTEVEAILDLARFVRIHRSYILNVDRLAKLELYAKDSHAAILRDCTSDNRSQSTHFQFSVREIGNWVVWP